MFTLQPVFTFSRLALLPRYKWLLRVRVTVTSVRAEEQLCRCRHVTRDTFHVTCCRCGDVTRDMTPPTSQRSSRSPTPGEETHVSRVTHVCCADCGEECEGGAAAAAATPPPDYSSPEPEPEQPDIETGDTRHPGK